MDHALHARIGVMLCQQSAVHALDEIKAPPLGGFIGRGIGEEGDGGIAHLRGQRHGRALVRSGQEGGAVVPRVDARMDGEKGGQVLVFGAEAVADPGTERGPRLGDGSGVHLEQSGAVLVVVRMHGTQQAKLIGDGGGVWQQIGNRESGLTARPHRDVRAKGQQPFCAVMTMLLGQRGLH